MDSGREVTFSFSRCFSICGKFKKFKTNKVVLTIVIGLTNSLFWNLVKSVLDKEDSIVPVYSPPFKLIF